MVESQVMPSATRARVRRITMELELPGGQRITSEHEASPGIAGLLFDDGLVRAMLDGRDDPEWEAGMRLWQEGETGRGLPAYITLPGVELSRLEAKPCGKWGRCMGCGYCK